MGWVHNMNERVANSKVSSHRVLQSSWESDTLSPVVQPYSVARLQMNVEIVILRLYLEVNERGRAFDLKSMWGT